ncbi:hypothetical protein GOP47_0028160 [Adiantum capillus-veneris]|nr:hypothetical protein GOP47_0028160 [Adiantum capillus-veneris]
MANLEPFPSWWFPYAGTDMALLYEASTERLARLMVPEEDRSLLPEQREKAIEDLAGGLQRTREKRVFSQPQTEPLSADRKREIEEAHKAQHAVFDMLSKCPKLSRGDFPPQRPPPEETGGHRYSDQQYEHLLQLVDMLVLPLQSARDVDLRALGYSSWKEYVVKAILHHWHPRISDVELIRKISFLPGQEPPPSPRKLPRRSMRNWNKPEAKPVDESSKEKVKEISAQPLDSECREAAGCSLIG